MKLPDYGQKELSDMCWELEQLGVIINEKAKRMNRLMLAFKEKWENFCKQSEDGQKGGKTDGK